MEQAKNNLRILRGSRWTGIAQLSLVEHALSPLKASKGCFVHTTEHTYYQKGRPQSGVAKVSFPLGFNPKKDELVLWGTLAMAFEDEPHFDVYTSGDFLLKRLGLTKTGPNRKDLRESLFRLGQVKYFNESFYDPIRKEHRAVGFGFLSHDIPTEKGSKRPWRISIDPIFFDLTQSAGGYLGFDLEVYRALSPSGRRLFHFLKKIFYKKQHTPYYDVRHLAVNVLGAAENQQQKKYNEVVNKAGQELISFGVVTRYVLEKISKGRFQVFFIRGEHYDRRVPQKNTPRALSDNPLYGTLKEIGLSDGHITNVFRDYKPGLIQTWADITLRAMEQGRKFSKSPPAFFYNYIKLGAEGKEHPPDWYLLLKKEELRKQNAEAHRELGIIRTEVAQAENTFEEEFNEFLDLERKCYEEFARMLADSYVQAGEPTRRACDRAAYEAREMMRKRFKSMQDYEAGKGGAAPMGGLVDMDAVRRLSSSE